MGEIQARSTSLNGLVAGVGWILDRRRAPAGQSSSGDTDITLVELRDRLAGALDEPHLVPEELLGHPPLPPTGVGTYLLHTDQRFVVFATVAAPGAVMPAHDHGSWGLVGVYRGIEEEIRYVPVNAHQPEGFVGLVETRRAIHAPGDIALIDPPASDIHHVINRDVANSVAVHVFGRDVVRQGFRIYVPVCRPTDVGPHEYQPLPTPVYERQ